MENVEKTQEEREPVSAAESFSREKPAAPAADAAAAPSLKVEAGDGKAASSIHLEEDASDALKTPPGGGSGNRSQSLKDQIFRLNSLSLLSRLLNPRGRSLSSGISSGIRSRTATGSFPAARTALNSGRFSLAVFL